MRERESLAERIILVMRALLFFAPAHYEINLTRIRETRELPFEDKTIHISHDTTRLTRITSKLRAFKHSRGEIIIVSNSLPASSLLSFLYSGSTR